MHIFPKAELPSQQAPCSQTSCPHASPQEHALCTTPDMLHGQSLLLSPSLHCLKTLTPGLDLALSSALPDSPETPPSLLSTRPGLEKLSAVSLCHFILTQPYSSCLSEASPVLRLAKLIF